MLFTPNQKQSSEGSSIQYVRKIFRKPYISYPRICTRQEVKNVSFSKNFAYVLNKWSLLKSWKNVLRIIAAMLFILNNAASV